MMRKTDVTKIINPAGVSLEDNFVRVDIKVQRLPQEVGDFTKATHEQLFALMNEHEIVGIPYVSDDFQFVLNKLIQFIQINICEQLRGQVAQRQARRIAVNYILQQSHELIIVHPFSQNIQKNRMVDRIKKLSHIQLQNPQNARIVARQFEPKFVEALNCCVSAFIFSGRPGIKNKELIPYWLNYPVDGVMEQPVTNRNFVNMTTLWIVDVKRKISAMIVGTVFQVLMQLENMIFEVYLELSHIFFVGFFFFKFRPSVEQVFQRNYFLEHSYGK
ncbi:MAG: hypothetical protein UV20_C0015G0001 [Candidatus Magasanikbacteria bacterium GW2011_GWA2_42_32]|uniref:Uncharacterized protein n=1 Tax=Candidatus Magasanikbacteria bacterium GW2011_GWA2_42_32 TaxID=1619039 RepID=A0A0G1A5R3_9BACT|nr:MAG: hypothetical protein UV20_C0015G0001 [Candidatus Magasanikbacteria bacterium GW2011_GWA2_42_32]